ncbi:MAG: hypothetical protein KIT49_06935 [Nitrospira sp.]|nr:hypothetical protein [Nitrospira sp.]
MPIREHAHRKQRLMAGAMLIIGLALAWLSVTPDGALSCLHCFLAQRWVEGTPAERRLAETQLGLPVAPWPAMVSGALPDPHKKLRSVPDDRQPACAVTSLLQDRSSADSLRPAPCRHDNRGTRSICCAPSRLGLRAPPRIVAT